MENILPVLNLTKICRVCLEECDDMFSIYSELFEDNCQDEMPRIYEILISISRIKVQPEDGFPTMICTKCIDKAHSSFKFQKLCNTSQSLLEAYIDRLKELEPDDLPTIDADIKLNDKPVKNEPKSESNLEFAEPSGDILPPELDSLNKEDLIKNDSPTEPLEDTNDCESLKSCLPLGEETIDQLIKDNLQDNLDLISPKMQSFHLNFRCSDEEELEISDINKFNEEPKPNMHYYMKEKDNDTLHEYQCNICNKGFRFANSLRIHLKNHNEEKPYVCTECKKAFKVYGALMHHVRSHSGEQPFECKVCGKKYRQSGTLTAHMRIHTGSKPFVCSICGRGFRQHPDLTYHMRTHTKEKPYMCTVCGKRMSMQCHLVQHMRSHTGEKPFKCPDCDKAFPSSTRLKRHSIIHTSLKPFKCNICDKSFNRKSSLRVHIKIHSGVKSYVCSVCNKGFMWAHSLRAHIAIHNKDKKGVKKKTDKKTKSKKVSDVRTEPIPDTKADKSALELNTMTIYTDESSEKPIKSESFAIYTSGDSNTNPETFQIYTVCADDRKEGIEFTLYSTDIHSNGALELPAVSL